LNSGDIALWKRFIAFYALWLAAGICEEVISLSAFVIASLICWQYIIKEKDKCENANNDQNRLFLSLMAYKKLLRLISFRLFFI
jgi:hypothetical protein